MPRPADYKPVVHGPQDPRLISEGAGYRIFSVSPLIDRDVEYHVRYDTELIVPGTKLLANGTQTFQSVVARSKMDSPIGRLLGAAPPNDFVLMDVQNEGGGEPWLVFARNLLPSSALLNAPSVTWDDTRTWQWHPIMRSFPQAAPNLRFVILNGNLISASVQPDVVPRYTGPTNIITKQYWTSQPWPYWMTRMLPMIPGVVHWDYIVNEGSIECLHGDITVPPLSGVTAVRGQACNPQSIQGIFFPRTVASTWVPDQVELVQRQVRGRWFMELQIAMPPFSPARFPPSPYVYSS